MKYLILPLLFVSTTASACLLLNGTYYSVNEKGCGWAYDINVSSFCKSVDFREYPVGGSKCERPTGNFPTVSAPIDGKNHESAGLSVMFNSSVNGLQVTIEGECNWIKKDLLGRVWIGPCGEGNEPFQLKKK